MNVACAPLCEHVRLQRRQARQDALQARCVKDALIGDVAAQRRQLLLVDVEQAV
jgi:hypothetical protein